MSERWGLVYGAADAKALIGNDLSGGSYGPHVAADIGKHLMTAPGRRTHPPGERRHPDRSGNRLVRRATLSPRPSAPRCKTPLCRAAPEDLVRLTVFCAAC